MNNQPYSIFNDVIGPVMTGPSSSHTAGPARIGYMVKHLLDSEPKELIFEFDKDGSFAATYVAHGSDRGFVGGLMGCTPDNPSLITALEDAKQKKIKFSFVITEFGAPHPNTVRIKAKGKDGETVTATGVSTGGGVIEIIEVNGFDVKITGKNYELLVSSEKVDIDNNASAKIKKITDGYEFFETAETYDRILFDIKLSQKPDEKMIAHIKKNFPSAKIRLIPPVFTILSRKSSEVLFRTAAEMENWAEKNNAAPWQAGLKYESDLGGMTPEDTMEKMINIVDIMEDTVRKGIADHRPGKFIKASSGNYERLSKEGKLINTGAIDTVIPWTLATMERNMHLGTVVAAPTAGSCGTMPGAVLGTAEYLGASKEEKAKAIFAAGAVGLAIAEQATFAAEICGCQAECGAASCMSAAGIVQLMGGNIKQSNTAASIALQNTLGMICDPVGDAVEVPCTGKNVMCAVNAVSSANMAMAGVDFLIPLDEVIIAMLEVGKMMPSELCCTNGGGLSTTKTSLELMK